MLRGVLEHDRAAERVADESRRGKPESLDEARRSSTKSWSEYGPGGFGLSPAPRRSGTTTRKSSRELFRLVLPDRRAPAAEPVQEHDRRARVPCSS